MDDNFDLETFIDIFDQALTSKDERVINALRSLMMIVVLTKPELQNETTNHRPLKQLYDDVNYAIKKINRLEDEIASINHKLRSDFKSYEVARYSAIDDYLIRNAAATYALSPETTFYNTTNLNEKKKGL